MLKFTGFKKYFKTKKIVYSNHYAPAEFVNSFIHEKTRYVRIAFTNKVKYPGSMPMTDIRFTEVWRIKELPSPFKKGCYNLLRLTAKPKYYNFNN